MIMINNQLLIIEIIEVKKMKKQLTQKDKISLRKSLRKLVQKDTVIVYCFAVKQSQTGISSNQRLILLNSSQKSIRYYSKPPDTLPFSNLSEIPEGKAKICVQKLQNFKYEACKGKSSTMKIQWQENKKKMQWVFTFSITKMMHEWIAAIDEMISGKISKDPTFVMGEQPILNKQQNNATKTNAQNTPINNLSNLAGTTPNKSTGQLNNSTGNTGAGNTGTAANTGVASNTGVNNANPNYTVSYTPPPQTGNVNTNTNALANNNASTNATKPQADQPQFVLTQPPQLNKNNNSSGNLGNSAGLNTQPNNTTSALPTTNTQINQPTTTNPTNQPTTNPINQPTTTNPNTTTTTQPKPTIPNVPPAYIAANPQYGDVAQEIKHLRKNGYQKFNLTNQLSQKNLHQNVNSQPQQSPAKQTKDNVQTKRQVYATTDPNTNVNSNSNNQNLAASAFSKKPATQLAQPQPPTQPQKNPRPATLPQPPPVKQIQQKIDYIKQSNISNKSLQDQQNPQGYNQFKRNPSKGPQTSLKSPPQMSQYYNQQQQAYESDNKKQLHRIHSQQPQLHISKFNNSRIKSQIGYNSRQNEYNQSQYPATTNKLKQHKKWNQLWCTHGNPMQIHQQFVKQCTNTAMQIIDQLPFIKSNRTYTPIKYQSPYYMYSIRGIVYNMHFFGDDIMNNSMPDSGRSLDDRAPLLYNHQSYTQAMRQFYNYNYILGVAGNNNIFKIPLSCYIEYKGILIFCKACIPDGFDKVLPEQCQKLLQQLQDIIKIRFIFNSMTIYVHPLRKYYILCDLQQLIPRIPIDIHPPVYFRKEYLLTNSIMIEDQTSLNKVYNKNVEQNIKEVVGKYESLQGWAINSHDLIQDMHRNGISMGCLSMLYQQSNFVYFKKVLLSEMAKNIFCDILRSQLNSVYATFPAREFDDLTIQYADKIILDCAHIMLNQLFSYSSRSQNIWRMIVKQVNRRYHVVISKQDIIPGYLLGGIMQYTGIECDYKTPNLNRKQTFFVKQSTIPRDLLLGFYPRIRRYDLDTVSPLVARIQDILSTQPNPDNFQQLVRSLNLRDSQIPKYLQNIKQQIIMYMCNFIPLGQHDQFTHIGIYDMLQLQPHNYCSTKISLLAIKWAAKKKNQQLANKIFQIKFEQNAFWVSEFNPAISEYYDFFSLYNVSTGNFEQAIKLAKSSLVNSIKLSGANSLPVADKHYQLGNIFFKIGRKQQALKQYLKTKQTLQNHKQTAIPQYGVILLKLSTLYLNFGKISDCVGNCLDALKIFDTNGNNQKEQIQTFQILSRSYQITRKVGDLNSVGALCAQKFNNTENPKIFQRMMKIVLFPKLTTINAQDAKTLLKLLSKLEELQSPITYIDAFNYLHFRAQNQIVMKKIFTLIDNISNLYEDVIRRDLLRKHKCVSNQAKVQASEMLVIMEAVVTMTGYNFINGCLKEYYY